MKNDINGLPSLEDAIKETEEFNNSIQNKPVEEVTPSVEEYQEPIQEEIEKPASINSDENISLMQMLEEQERNKPKHSISDPEEYVKYYIGDKYDVFKNGGISFCYFLFGEYYLIYRKMYIPAIIKYLITFALLVAILFTYNTVNSVFAIVCLLIFVIIQVAPIFVLKKFYYNFSKNNVMKIIEENKDKGHDEIVRICDSKGGTNFLPVIVLFLLSGFLTNYRSLFTSSEMQTYEIGVKYLNTLSTNYLKLEKTNTDAKSAIIQNECIVRIKSEKNNGDFESFLNSDSYQIENINRIDWYKVGVEPNITYYSQDSQYYYMVETQVLNNNKNCQKSVDILIKNLKLN